MTSATRRLRIVFMGTPEFALPSLEALHEAHEVVAVFTQPDRPSGRGGRQHAAAFSPPVKQAALRFGLAVLQPEKLGAAEEQLRALRPDVIVVVAYGQLLKQVILEIPALGCLNLHASLLPRWRGAAPIQRALLAGDAVTGVTAMQMVRALDAGNIFFQERVAIQREETAASLQQRLADLGGPLLLKTLHHWDEAFASGKPFLGAPQDPGGVLYAAKLDKAMEKLDWQQGAAIALERQVRALQPWPGTSLWVLPALERLKVKAARACSALEAARAAESLSEIGAGGGSQAGKIVAVEGKVFLGVRGGSEASLALSGVGLSGSEPTLLSTPTSFASPPEFLQLLKLQWEGKKEMNEREFLNGLSGKKLTLPLSLALGPA